MRRMCECENSQCPFHVGKECDIPAVAKVHWHGFLTSLCQQCLDMAAQTGAGNLEILNPITASSLPLFPEKPLYRVEKNRDTFGMGEPQRVSGWVGVTPSGGRISGVFASPEDVRAEILKRFGDVEVEMPARALRARLLKKGAKTGNETFDRVWNDFHGKMAEPENEEREFHDMLLEEPGKHQLLISLGKLNYMVENEGLDGWVAEGYAGATGDLLLKKLPAHTHTYPLLSKLHELLKEVLTAYSEFGVKSFADLEHFMAVGPNRNTLWDWFKRRHKHLFRFRGRVNEPYDLEAISGKWGHIRLDDEPLTAELVEKYESELDETEAQLDVLPDKDTKFTKAKREDLLEYEAELDSVLEALHYRMSLQTAWKEFKTGGWVAAAEKKLSELTEQYRERVTLTTLVGEAAELFDATPDEVFPIEQEGEEKAQYEEEKELPKAAGLVQ